jgi:ferredoxin
VLSERVVKRRLTNGIVHAAAITTLCACHSCHCELVWSSASTSNNSSNSKQQQQQQQQRVLWCPKEQSLLAGGARSSNDLLLQLKESQRTFAQCTQRFADTTVNSSSSSNRDSNSSDSSRCTASRIKRLKKVLQWRMEHLTGASLLLVAEVHDALAR